MKEFKGEQCLPRPKSDRLEHGNYICYIHWNSNNDDMLGAQENPDVFEKMLEKLGVLQKCLKQTK